MASEEVEYPSLRELAREEPEAVRAVARRADGRLQVWLERVLREAAED